MLRRLLICVTLLFCAAPAFAAQSIALFGETKYHDGFRNFDYVNPDAPKGGTIKLAANATFDSTNPFILKGLSAPGLQNYLYQTLMVQSYDEPQSFYPLIANSVTLADDRRSAIFTLDPRAKWHDGEAITADDVVWTFNTLKEKGHPTYRIQFKPITVTKIGERTVRFTFDDPTQRELPLIAASMPVLPQHYFAKIPFEKTSLAAPLGSGPYKVASIDAGRSIVYERVKDYWGRTLPSQVGLNNFDRVQIDIYRDDVVSAEGIKSHQFDYFEEFIARNWATSYDTQAVREGKLVKARIPHKIPRGMQGFLFNTRLPKFNDPRVREAIDLSLDFEWMNPRLFYGAYSRNSSYFNNTDFAASGLPTGAEKALLDPYRKNLPKSTFTTVYKVPTTDGSGSSHDNLVRAQKLLEDAGWVMKNGVRTNAKTGEVMTIEFLMMQRTFERVIAVMRHNLKRLGIESTFRYVDASQYQKRIEHRNFDIISIWWNQGLFYPGQEQFMYWHSSQADVEGSQNLGGVKNPAVDKLVDRIRSAQTLEQLKPLGRALDRVLLNEHYVIPHWNINAWRVLYWDQFGRPPITPAYNPAVDSWWAKELTPATPKAEQPATPKTEKTEAPVEEPKTEEQE